MSKRQTCGIKVVSKNNGLPGSGGALPPLPTPAKRLESPTFVRLSNWIQIFKKTACYLSLCEKQVRRLTLRRELPVYRNGTQDPGQTRPLSPVAGRRNFIQDEGWALERIRFNPARIQLRRSSWHIRWA